MVTFIFFPLQYSIFFEKNFIEKQETNKNKQTNKQEISALGFQKKKKMFQKCPENFQVKNVLGFCEKSRLEFSTTPSF